MALMKCPLQTALRETVRDAVRAAIKPDMLLPRMHRNVPRSRSYGRMNRSAGFQFAKVV